MANRIILDTHDQPFRMEGTASEAITPGHLLEFVASGGDTGQLKKHATAGGNVADVLFAVEQDFFGKGIADAYADADLVQYARCGKGNRILAWIVANGAAVVVGDKLESAGDGTLRKHTAQEVDEAGSATVTVNAESIVAVALEAKDNSAVATAARLRVAIV